MSSWYSLLYSCNLETSPMRQAYFRFYEELNDFLPLDKRKVKFTHFVPVNAAIKDVVESLGVPHTEIDLILVNGASVNFSYQVKNGDDISVYPMFEALDISPLVRLRPKPLRHSRFILDVHLGKLARHLRLLGFDAAYENNYTDNYIITHAHRRIILTRDLGILKNKQVTRGYWIRNTNSEKQLQELMKRFDLFSQVKPFSRCLECNSLLHPIPKKEIEKGLPALTKKYFENFSYCKKCKKSYWQGSHYTKLKIFVEKMLGKT